MKEVRTLIIFLLLSFSLSWSSGCSVTAPYFPKKETPPLDQSTQISPSATEVEKYFTHTIKWTGENLIRISWWYTGSGNKWLEIIEANPSIDPDRMRIGDTILIPEKLLVTNEPMPVDYRGPEITKKIKAEPSEKPLPKTQELELFGPIDDESPTGQFEETSHSLPSETIE